MSQRRQGQFLVYSVLPTDYGVALSQTGDKRQGWPKIEPVVWHFPMPLSMTPEYWSRSWLAPQHGGRRGVVKSGNGIELHSPWSSMLCVFGCCKFRVSLCFWNIDVSQRNWGSQASACCKIVLFEIITLIQLGTIK